MTVKYKAESEDSPAGPSAGDAPSSVASQPVVQFLEHWLHVLRRRWRVITATWCIVMAGAAVVLLTTPRRFEASATFLVRNARQELLVGPNDRATAVYREDVSEEILNSELELMRSPSILTDVVRNLELDRDHLARSGDQELAVQLAVRDFSRALATNTIRKTNMIRVAYADEDADLAARVVRRLADAYLAAHLAVHSSPGTYELFQRQAEDASRELEQSEQELAALARSANLVIPELQKKSAVDLSSTVDAAYRDLTAEIQAQLARVRAAETAMVSTEPRVKTAVRTIPNQYSVERLNTLTVELQNKRTQLLTKFNADDRLVAEVDQQISETRAALEAASGGSATEESTDVNPAWRALETESMNARLALAALTGKVSELRRQMADYRNQVLVLTESSPRYEALVRKVSAARGKFELYVKKEEEARIAAALDTQQISNVVLAQPPYVARLPVTPDIRFGLLVAVLSATLLAGCAAFLAEHAVVIWTTLVPRRPAVVDADARPRAGAHT